MAGGIASKVGLGAVLAGLTLLLAAPMPAEARPGRDFYGVNPVEDPSAEELARMGQGGIGTARIVFFIGNVQSDPNSWDWRHYDGVVADAARVNVTVLPLLFGSAPWLTESLARPPIDSAAQRAAWSRFVFEAARRYGPNGYFWAAHPELPPRPLKWWQVWNEPNIAEFVGGQPKVKDYATLLRVTAQGLRSGDPAVSVATAGFYRRPKRGLGIPMTRFLDRLYQLKRTRAHFDAVAIHPYGRRPAHVLEVSAQARRIMRENRDARSPLWVSEVGWSTGGNGWANSPYRATPQKHAVLLRKTYGLLVANRKRLRLTRVLWHSWRDIVGGPDFWTQYMGLFTNGGEPKPAWHALRRVTQGSGTGRLYQLGRPKPPEEPCLIPPLIC